MPVHTHVWIGDAWEESKHPRGEGGQFGSGGKIAGKARERVAMRSAHQKKQAKAGTATKKKPRSKTTGKKETAELLNWEMENERLGRENIRPGKLASPEKKPASAPKPKRPKAEKAAINTGAHAEALEHAGTDEPKFKAALESLSKLSKADVQRIAHEYTGGGKSTSKKAALEAISKSFIQRGYEESRMKIVEKYKVG